MSKVTIFENTCKGCGLCVTVCPKKILYMDTSSINSKGSNPARVSDEEKCISSVEMLSSEIEKSIAAGFMSENPYKDFKNYDSFDLHRPYIDNVILVSESGKKMFREPDLIDVWFDSGAMPYAQVHYPFD